MTADGCVSVLIVDDHPVIRLGLRSAIESQPDLRVVAEATSAAAALALTLIHRPDLVLLPLRLEGEFKGVELCREIVAGPSAPRVLVYTSFNGPDDASAAFLSGAHSFVHKGAETERLLEAIRATRHGRRVWLLGADHDRTVQRLQANAATANLTPREQEVLGLLLQRLTNAQISRQLFIELATVKTHVRNILGKLGVASRRELFQTDPPSDGPLPGRRSTR